MADNALRRAELDLVGVEMLPGITAEKNRLIFEEAKAKVQQLRKTSDLHNRVALADLRTLEIQRERAKSAWDHAAQNAERMRIESPLDGLVVLKSIWKNGSMGEVQEGEEVRAGIPILDVVDPTMMRVRANVNQADAAQLTPGAPVRITLDSYPARTFTGRVANVSPVAMTSSMSQRGALLPRRVLDGRHGRTSASRSRRSHRHRVIAGASGTREAMNFRRRAPRRAVVAVGGLAALAAMLAGARYVRAAGVSLPSMVLETSTFVNVLEVRGEIRPLRSVVLTAPSSGGSDLQIINLARNGASVAAGDIVVEFDSTPQQRTARTTPVGAAAGAIRSREGRVRGPAQSAVGRGVVG